MDSNAAPIGTRPSRFSGWPTNRRRHNMRLLGRRIVMTPFAGVDYYDLDELLSDEERLIRKTVRNFVEREAVPIIEDHHAREAFPTHLIPQMAELGLFGANLKGYGCAGLNNVSYGLICQELERCDSGLRSMVSVQGSLCMYPIHAFGSEAQKQRWLPPMASGAAIGCFGLTNAW